MKVHTAKQISDLVWDLNFNEAQLKTILEIINRPESPERRQVDFYEIRDTYGLTCRVPKAFFDKILREGVVYYTDKVKEIIDQINEM